METSRTNTTNVQDCDTSRIPGHYYIYIQYFLCSISVRGFPCFLFLTVMMCILYWTGESDGVLYVSAYIHIINKFAF